jgi:hypothetical protein
MGLSGTIEGLTSDYRKRRASLTTLFYRGWCLKLIDFSAYSAYLSVLCVKLQSKRRGPQRYAENRRDDFKLRHHLRSTPYQPEAQQRRPR